jgi:predicted small secreted protein
MKKLLLVLMVVALASFLFVGCFPTTPAEGEGEGEGEAELCPAVSLSGGVDVAGKLYVKAGKAQTITITFGTVTEPVNLFVGPCNEKAMPTGVPESSSEVILRTTDKKVYTGTYKFSGECCELYLYLMYGTGEVICKYPVIVDGEGPYAKMEVEVAECPCEDCAVTFTSDWIETGDCEDTVGCCDDDCSGFASWAIDIYDEDPFDECCSLQCAEPVDFGSGTACPVDFTTECLEAGKYWAIINLADKVGNETRYFASLVFDEDCEIISGTEYDSSYFTEDNCYPEMAASAAMNGFVGDCGDRVWTYEDEVIEPCPVVTFDPIEPIVGEPTTITATFEVPTDDVAMYVGPSIKTLPLGVPENAQEVVLTTTDDVVYTALYTFGQAGTDYIYVTLGCEDCTPCKTAVTVSTDGVRVFLAYSQWYWEGGVPIIPVDSMEVDMTTTDNMKFEGEGHFEGRWCWDEGEEEHYPCGCRDMWVYVLSGESCCPVVCSEAIIVDNTAPCIEITAIAEECLISGPCPPVVTGEKIRITNQADYPGDGPRWHDNCTEIAGWEMTLYCMNPYHDDEGCEDPDPETICGEASGTQHDDVDFTTACSKTVPTEKYPGYVRFCAWDVVGNEECVWGELFDGHFIQGEFKTLDSSCVFVPDRPPYLYEENWIGFCDQRFWD